MSIIRVFFAGGGSQGVRDWGQEIMGKQSVFRGQISENARFLDSDVSDRIGCWRGFFLMLGKMDLMG
jgi:hypothetical protein